jgi:hypothetical protein
MSSTQSQIVSLIQQIEAIPNAIISIGRGAVHPSEPDTTLADDLSSYWKAYPYLLKDKGYVHFMQMYCGMHIYRPDYDIAIDVPGFTDASSTIIQHGNDFLWLGESSIFQAGLLIFCDAMLPAQPPSQNSSTDSTHVVGTAFGFNPAQPGIFRTKNQTGQDMSEVTSQDTYFYCEDFIEWLTILVKWQGYFPETNSN